MTAFSRQDRKVDNTELSWEIRTVNHRHLDISLHIPEALNVHENEIKEIIRQKLGRGRVDLKLTVSHTTKKNQESIRLNTDKAKALLQACERLKSLSPQSASPTTMEILQWSGVMEETQNQHDDYFQAAKQLLAITLDDLIKMRKTEGEKMEAMIASRSDSVIEIVESVKARRSEVVKALREKVIQKLAELDVTADSNRLEQELVYQAQRLDVDEELDRLGAHIEEVYAVLKRDEPIGRRLDFLMQELNREANTLASKSNDAETTRSAVELKVLIEQMREQCLNIE